MESQPQLSELSAHELRGELKWWEKRRSALLAAFPFLEDGSASLTAQYVGGPEWDELAEAKARIAKLKLELIRRDQASHSPEDAEKKEPARNAPSRTNELMVREKKIWKVIQRGLKGLSYCQELKKAGVKPRRAGSWKDCPGTYPAAYKDGHWRQRIQDEKSKIRRKAELAKLAGE